METKSEINIMIMKSLNTAIIIVFVFILYYDADPVYFNCLSNFQDYPLPTEIIMRDQKQKNDFKLERKKWIENMHRAAPGTDWKKMDAAAREEKRQAKSDLRRILLKSGSLDLKSDNMQNTDFEGAWREVGSNNQGGRVVSTEIDYPNRKIYSGSAGGNIWIGSLSGSNWNSINDYFQLDGLNLLKKIDLANHSRIIAAHNKYVRFSDDAGFTWSTAAGLEGFVGWGNIIRTVVTFNGEIFVLGREWDYSGWHATISIYHSINNGETFSLITKLGDVKADLWASGYTSSSTILLINNTLNRVAEGSVTQIAEIPVDFPVSEAGMVSLTGDLNGTNLYADFVVSGTSRIYCSNNSGFNWTERGSVQSGLFTVRSFSCSLVDGNKLFLGNVDAYRSFDGGYNWEIVNHWYDYYNDPENKLHADIPEIKSFLDESGNENTYISTDGGLYLSQDNLLTVSNLSLLGLRNSQYYSTYTSRSDAQTIFAGSQDQGFQKAYSDDGNILNFEQTISGDYGHLVSGNGGASVWCNYPGFTMLYPNAINSNSISTFDFSSLSNRLWLPPICEDIENPFNALLAAGTSTTGAHLWYLQYNNSTNQITSTEGIFDFSDGISNAKISAIGYSKLNRSYKYVLTDQGKFYYSPDYGISWNKSQNFGGVGSHYFYGASIVSSPIDEAVVFVAGSGYSNPPVYISENHGIDFTPFDNGLPNTLVFDMDISDDGKYLFAATEVGPYLLDTSEGMWYDIAGLYAPDQTYWSVEYIPVIETARFGTYGRGIWDFKIDVTVPVEMISFTGALNGNSVILKWQTASETNNLGFEIERASSSTTSGSPSQGEWKKIGFVRGNGNSLSVHNYQFDDNSVQSGNFLYRLKQIDYNGRFNYSSTIEVEITPPSRFVLEQNYPNPFGNAIPPGSPFTKIKYSLPTIAVQELSRSRKEGDGSASVQVKLIVFDMLGQEVRSLVNEEQCAGEYEVEFNEENLSSGVYLYSLSAGEYKAVKKMMLIR